MYATTGLEVRLSLESHFLLLTVFSYTGVHCRYGARCKFRHGPMPQFGQDPRMGFGQPQMQGYGFPQQQGSPQGQGQQGQQNLHGGVYLNGYNGSGHDG